MWQLENKGEEQKLAIICGVGLRCGMGERNEDYANEGEQLVPQTSLGCWALSFPHSSVALSIGPPALSSF